MTLDVLKSHHLFKIANFEPISSPVDVGFHPDSVLSTFDPLTIAAKFMPKSAIRGDSFVAVRCAPIGEYDLAHAKVECVYLKRINDKQWTPHKMGSELSESAFTSFTQLAQGSDVEIDGVVWRKI